MSLAAVLVLAGLLAAVPANATELKDAKAHFIVDVPNSWSVAVEGDYAMASPKDNTFHLRMAAAADMKEEQAEEARLLSFIGRHFNDVKVDNHVKKVAWNNFVGFEVFGTGKEKNADATPGKWFALILVDKRDTKKGAVVLGTGTVKGFDTHHAGIREALHTMRTY